MSKLVQAYDLAEYEDFINQEQFAGRPLAEYVAEVQRIYCADKRPWVIGYSGGKDSSAVITLVYLALLGLPPQMRSKDVFLVSSDTLVETPVVVDLIKKTMLQIEAGAKRNGLPITQHAVMPKTNETFWVNLLGKGYPAPTRSFRWCTERMKINPVSDFIKDKVSQFDEVIVVLGSRSTKLMAHAWPDIPRWQMRLSIPLLIPGMSKTSGNCCAARSAMPRTILMSGKARGVETTVLCGRYIWTLPLRVSVPW